MHFLFTKMAISQCTNLCMYWIKLFMSITSGHLYLVSNFHFKTCFAEQDWLVTFSFLLIFTCICKSIFFSGLNACKNYAKVLLLFFSRALSSKLLVIFKDYSCPAIIKIVCKCLRSRYKNGEWIEILNF